VLRDQLALHAALDVTDPGLGPMPPSTLATQGGFSRDAEADPFTLPASPAGSQACSGGSSARRESPPRSTTRRSVRCTTSDRSTASTTSRCRCSAGSCSRRG
jgi:hypothetical protein